MDIFEFRRESEKKLRLAVQFVRRILFAPNHFHLSLPERLKANFFGGYTADQWALYHLNLRNRKEYLSEFDWYRSRYIDEPFEVMLNNKVIASLVLQPYIHVPAILFQKNRQQAVDAEGKPVTAKEICAYLQTGQHLIYKPYDKGRGKDVFLLAFDNGTFSIDRQACSEAQICALLDGSKNWFCSETVQQHPYAAGLYAETVNTLRMITLRDPETGVWKLFFAVQRIGRASTIPVDNGSRGGLVCKVDLETGQLSYGRTLHDDQVYYTHPDSGTVFSEVFVPDWDNVKREVLLCASHFPFLSFIAWDVVILPDGQLCVIEMNASSGNNIVQLWGGQRNAELGAFYRHYGVIK